METGERHRELSAGQRSLDLQIATESVAGGLLDLQQGGRLKADIDPMEIAFQIEDRYRALWNELTSPFEYEPGETFKIEQRLERLHELGFDVEEMDIVDGADGGRFRFVPRVVEHGFHSTRLKNLTGLEASENQARRLLADIRSFGAELADERASLTTATGMPLRPLAENVVAVRWLDDRFERLMLKIPAQLFDKLEAAEIYHQLLEHRWFLSEDGRDHITLDAALDSYIIDVLATAPNEVNITREAPDDPDTIDPL